MNIRQLIDGAIQLAHLAGNVLPASEVGADIAEKIVDLVDGLKKVSPDAGSTADLEAAHVALLAKIQDKGGALSNRLRGQ